MNGKMKKLLALLLVLCLSLGCLAACGQSGSQTEPDVSTAEIDAITEAASSLLPTHGSTEGKEETVYVIADANGKPERTIVSAWLKNPEEANTINDRSDLSGIENVKGDESFTKAADGSLVWDAQGSDIYYQGDSKQELPLEVHVSYKLDGKEVKPEDLEGASGHLEMTFSYENKASRQEKIGGEDVTVYQPFFVVSCLVLDASKASAVEVTNGTTINSGEQVIVAGMAMPGLKESLGLDELEDAEGETLDADLPETVTINADVTDFSLLTTVTLVENALLNDLDLDNVEGFDDLKRSINKLVDASSQLVNGASDLYDGTKSLSDGSGQLAGGAAQLAAAVSGMTEGEESIAALKAGSAQLAAGLKTYQEAFNKFADPAFKTQLETMEPTLTSVAGQLGGLNAKAEELEKAFTDLQTNKDALPALEGSLQGVGGNLQTISDSATAIGTGTGAALAALTSLKTMLETAPEANADALKQVGNAIAALGGIPDQLGTIGDAATKAGKTLTDAGTNLESNIGSVTAGLGDVETQALALQTSLENLAGFSEKLQPVLGSVKDLPNLAPLPDGAAQLDAGIGKLAAGAEELNAGVQALNSGAKELDGGVKQVMNGASSLLDGLRTFDGDGVRVLSRLFEQDAQGFMDRLRAVQAFGEEYDNFSGLADGMPGMVRFIIRTDSIGE